MNARNNTSGGQRQGEHSKHGMNGMGYSMRAIKQSKAFLGILLLTLGLAFTSGYAQAEETGKDTARAEQDATRQSDRKEEHIKALPTLTLTAPAAGSANLYPAAFNLEATVTFPGKEDSRDDKREGVEIEFLANGVKFAETERAPYRASYTPHQAGHYSFTARIRYGEGRRTILSNTVDVTSDLPPIVSLNNSANNAVQTAPATFVLTANASAPIGSIAKVDFYNGSTLIGTATTATGGSYSFTWTNVAAGRYNLTARATDNYGVSTTSAPVSVISDALPTVSLTGPAAHTISSAPGSFTLTAAAASTTSTIAKVEFYNGTTLLGTATAAPYSFIWNNVPAGKYSLTAKATDALGTANTSTPVSVISDAPPIVTLTSPIAGARITSPNSLTLTATATSVTSTIAKVEFYNGTTLLGSATATPYSFIWTKVPVGSYSLTAKATDALGTATTSSATPVTAIADVPPTVSLTSPANGATVKVSGSFTLTAHAGSTTNSVARVDFYANRAGTHTLIGTATAAPYSFTWSNLALGSYSLTAVATDSLNATTTSMPVSVTVNSGTVQAYYIYSDQLDTPRQITDGNGNAVWQWDNTDPFGNNTPNENPNGAGTFNFNLRFPGQYADQETNTYYNFFRDYDPSIGRYVQSDPIGLLGGINGYVYALSNPLSFIDPTGLDITISFNGSAAAGAGHVGIGVNSPNTVGQRPQAGQNPVAIAVGQNVPGQISPDPAPDARVVIPTTPRQDQQARQCIDTRTREQQNYNLYQNNCAQFVGQCLNAAGVPVPNTRYPRTLFNDIQRQFGGNR